MRRRRAPKEIAFSFDSFLDLVANVVGIILRLILIAWVGARAYKGFVPPQAPPPAALAEPASLPEPTDPRRDQLARERLNLRQGRDDADLRDSEQHAAEAVARRLRADLDVLASRQKQLQTEERAARSSTADRAKSAKLVHLTLEELRDRSRRLQDEMEKLQKRPVARKELRYRTPISAPVTEEVMFERKDGRVSLIDTAAMLAEVRREIRGKADDLRSRWQVTDLTAPVGAFRLRYVVERERGMLDGPGGAPADPSYRYGVAGWEVVPVLATRGESAELALTSDSAFRKLIDGLDPGQTAVTLWVYPDSFPLYRTLRDFMHDKNLMVAGRPLPEGVPIASSRQGTVSRGQ